MLCAADSDCCGLTDLTALGERGAAGVAVRCDDSWTADALQALLGAAAAAKLDALVIAASPPACDVALSAGAALVACDGFAPAGEAAESGATLLGVWSGEPEELYAMRDAGLGAALLEDGCGGDFRAGAAWCESRVQLARSKQSRTWGGSMFGSTSSEAPPPSARNPRLWAQSQRQAREMMHESARSRDLPPPKLKSQARYNS